MRRAAATGALILGVLVLLLCGTVGGLYWAARYKLEDRFRRVAQELERRSRLASSHRPLDWPPYLELLEKLQDSPKRVRSELGICPFDLEDLEEIQKWRKSDFPFDTWTAHTDCGFRNRHHVAVWGGFRSRRIREIPLQLALAQDVLHGGGYWGTLLRASNEGWIHYHSLGEFGVGMQDPAELARCAEALDLLESRRPSLQDEVEVEHLLRCRDVLQVYRSGQDPERLIPDPVPGLRSLYSRTVLFNQALNRLDDELYRVQELLSQPPQVWWSEYQNLPTATPPLSASFVWLDRFVLRAEAQSANRRTVLKTAVAIERFAAEDGRLPDRLEELVPRFLAKVPVCPLTGNRLSWAGGILRADVDDDMAEWTARAPLAWDD